MQNTKQITIMNQAFEIKYPSVGEKLQIENIKLLLTDGSYGELAMSGHNTAIELLDLVDAVSYFTILIPEIKASLELKDFLDMDPKRANAYVKAYKKQFRNWMNAIDTENNREDSDDIEEATNI